MNLIAGLIHALPVGERRVLNRGEAASYVGVSPGHFETLVLSGTLPFPLPGYGRTRRWDRAAIDQALDRASGLSTLLGAPSSNAYDMWSNSRGQG